MDVSRKAARVTLGGRSRKPDKKAQFCGCSWARWARNWTQATRVIGAIASANVNVSFPLGEATIFLLKSLQIGW